MESENHNKKISDSRQKWQIDMQIWTFKNRLKLLTGSVIIILATFIGFKYLFPYVWPFLLAYIIAIAIERPVKRLASHMGGKKGIASTIIVTGLLVIILGITGYIVYMGIHEMRLFIKNYDYYMIVVKQQCARVCLDLDGWLGFRAGCCMDMAEKCMQAVTNSMTTDGGAGIANKVVKISFPVVVNTAVIIGTIIVSIMSIVYLSNVLNKIRMWRQVTIFREEVHVITKALKNLMDAYFKVQLIIMAINSALCIGGLLLLNNSYAVVIGLLIGIIDALPIFGTGTILIPWAVILLLLKDMTGAAVLVTVYVITYFVREIMESKCMGNRMGIAPFTMLMVIFVGLMIYGIMGFILGPVSYVIIKALIVYLKTIIERGKLENV